MAHRYRQYIDMTRITDLVSGLNVLAEKFSHSEHPLDDHGIIRQIGNLRGALDKLEVETKNHLRNCYNHSRETV